MHPVDRLARRPERGDLGRRLAHPQRRHHLGRQPQARGRQRLRELEDVQRPHPVAQRDELRAADLARDDPERVRELAPRDHVDVQLAGRRGLGRLQLESGHDQERVVVGGHRQAGEPLQLLGVVAGHVAQVGPGGEQQDVDARLTDGLLHPGESLGRVEGGVGGHEISSVHWVTTARKRLSEEPSPRAAPISVSSSGSGGVAGRAPAPSMSSGSGTSVAVLTTGGAMSR